MRGEPRLKILEPFKIIYVRFSLFRAQFRQPREHTREVKFKFGMIRLQLSMSSSRGTRSPQLLAAALLAELLPSEVLLQPSAAMALVADLAPVAEPALVADLANGFRPSDIWAGSEQHIADAIQKKFWKGRIFRHER